MITMASYFQYTVTGCTVSTDWPRIETTHDENDMAMKRPAKGPKLYAVTRARDTVYVGMTTQPLTNRLRYGFSASGKSGYHGYAWAKVAGRYCIHCWQFPSSASSEDLETVEAEMVYDLRRGEGQWPKYQTEIHFHQSSTRHRSLAALLIKDLRKRLQTK